MTIGKNDYWKFVDGDYKRDDKGACNNIKKKNCNDRGVNIKGPDKWNIRGVKLFGYLPARKEDLTGDEKLDVNVPVQKMGSVSVCVNSRNKLQGVPRN
jgi:hypothetical protein